VLCFGRRTLTVLLPVGEARRRSLREAMMRLATATDRWESLTKAGNRLQKKESLTKKGIAYKKRNKITIKINITYGEEIYRD
jgi:hypothetical protein